MNNPGRTDDSVLPFLKWAGGKRWLAPEIMARFPGRFRRYYEPFLGGGAVFFRLKPEGAVLSDANAELINTYVQVRESVEDVIARLRRMRISEQDFYRIRSSTPRSPAGKAARFIYLNRTAFNGLYRVSRQGRFNVPFGCKPGTALCQEAILRAASQALHKAELVVSDFEDAMNQAGRGDLIYADPPYSVRHDSNAFRKYNERMFSWEDQLRLANGARRALARGTTVVVSNAHSRDVKELYRGSQATIVTRTSVISGKIKGRGRALEYLFLLAPP